MGLNSALSIATSGLNVVQNAMAVASNNVSNAGTSGYIKENANVQSTVAGNTGIGVRTAATTLATNEQVQKALYAQNADVAAYTATSNSLSNITALQGSTTATSGSSGTLSDQLGNLQSALTSLTSTPDSASAQSTVVSAAASFAQSVNTLSSAYQTQRQTAQNSVVSSVSDINTDLTTIGTLSTKIMNLKSTGQDTAALENQRYTALSSLSSELSVSWSESANGDMTISTADGVTLPTRDTSSASPATVSSTWPLSTSSAQISVSMTYPGTSSSNTIPAITLNGKDVTTHLTGGTLGANITLRDTTLPTMQAQLDSLTSTVATRFSDQGMPLFTSGADGSVPGSSQTDLTPTGSVGFSQEMSVSSVYSDDPSKLLDNSTSGTQTVLNVLNNSFGSSGTAAPSTNLGMTKNLSTGYTGDQGIISLATSLTAKQAATASDASSGLALSQTTQTSLTSNLSGTSTVSVDTEMANIVTLQNAYAANAKVVSTVQTMFSALLSAIGS
ncbi:flagellar hook-associated protein FlgK [Gluconobacter sp. LMG 31484]|uniref:Flagellar hook-associated protein 1 n=1 Tax=Gluconobacter vitians TaxID=2728102 RepID=A0ABR9Y4G5_9PROT|nr:flagellar hook-associated protein FlgK [Gluconobacter vitians]MBF0858732.1 flagellar hook-associated protein FlgK [Gluconobacter vitians]